MNGPACGYLSEAIQKLFDIANSIDVNQQDAFKILGDETAQICISYQNKLDELQKTILNEQRTNLLIRTMLGNSTV